MAQVINTNVSSLTAQRNLNNTGGALKTSLERLSSGLRINSAKDDAAGLAIAARMSAQIRGFNQAARNANDGISFAQTSEGALSTVTDNMQRIRQLAVQAANATNNADDRASLDKEMQLLVKEIDRVANQTEFNNSPILDGTLGDMFFQIGANQGQTIAVKGADARATELGTSEAVGAPGLDQSQVNRGIQSVEDMTVTIEGIPDPVKIEINLSEEDIRSLDDMVRVINDRIGQVNGSLDGSFSDAEVKTVNEANLKASIRVLDNGNSTIVLNGAFNTSAAPAPEPPNPPVFKVAGGEITLNDPEEDVATFPSEPNPKPAGQVNLTELDIRTRENAYKTIGAIDSALDVIRGFRAEFGAAQSRFEANIRNVQLSAENVSASRSRIQDTDFAAETAELTRVQILQQSGNSVLAQANAAPQNVLSLLQQ
jgi:flagellin